MESAPINITPREKRRENAVWAECATRSQRPWPGTAGRPVTRLRAVPRAIAPPMASNVRSEEYARLKAEFDTMQVEMDALGIGASSKKLEEFEDGRRHRAAKRKNLVGHARRDNTRAIDRAEKAAAAAAASEAGSSSANAGPSVRVHSNIPSPLLARLTTRSIAQRSGSKTALARLWRVARVSSLLAAVRQVLPWIKVAHYLDKFGAPPDPTKPREVFRQQRRRSGLLGGACREGRPRRARRPVREVGLGRDALRRRRVSGSRTCARVSVGYRVARTGAGRAVGVGQSI